MSDESHIPAGLVLSASLAVLLFPTRARFLAFARLSQGRWLGSLMVYIVGATICTALVGGQIEFLALLPTAFLIGILAVAWAAAAEVSSRWILGKGDDLFEPLLALAATSLLLLMFVSVLISFLPPPLDLLNALIVAYSQVLVVLAIRAFRRTTLAGAILIAGTAAVLGLVIAFAGWQIVGGMPGFFERGSL